jgi:polyhydroxyalkanoate synthesis regulator phasin
MSMTRRKKLTFAAGAAGVAVVVAGLGAAGAIAASRLWSPSEESKAIIDDAAEQLGVEPAELSDALKQALKNRIDEAVEAGRLTEEQGAALKERIDENEYPLLVGPGFRGRGGHGFGPHGHYAIFEAAASYLGLTEAELREQLRDKTLADIAKEQGKTVDGLVQQLVATQAKRIDEAVADGKLTSEQASELKSGLRERTEALVNGLLRGGRRDSPRPRFWPGSGGPRGPPSFFGGPSA